MGTVLLYPSGSADMTLQVHKDGFAWKAHLELKFGRADFKDESIDVVDLQVRDHRFSFHDPKSWNRPVGDTQAGYDVDFEGVRTTSNELQGRAEMTKPEAEGQPHWLGTWHLQRQFTVQH
jgi:hypothetical protein